MQEHVYKKNHAQENMSNVQVSYTVFLRVCEITLFSPYYYTRLILRANVACQSINQ